jgi:glycosyltransferase involved in cell wall biosynthesis
VRLGVRQDLRAYTRERHAGRGPLRLAAGALEAAFRLLARRLPVAVVGADLARRYGGAWRLHLLHVSLVSEADLAAGPPAPDPRRVISVGRLDPEKNPLLLADVAAALGAGWTLDVYGDGPLAGALADRARELGAGDRVTLHGYVPAGDGLARAYREAGALLHVSLTEGMPQVLLEAFGAHLPVVATAVGGVPALAADAALLVAPRDAAAAAAALRRLADEPGLRERLAQAGAAIAREHTLEAEARRLAAFLLDG